MKNKNQILDKIIRALLSKTARSDLQKLCEIHGAVNVKELLPRAKALIQDMGGMLGGVTITQKLIVPITPRQAVFDVLKQGPASYGEIKNQVKRTYPALSSPDSQNSIKWLLENGVIGKVGPVYFLKREYFDWPNSQFIDVSHQSRL